jgi:hypothetical protein
MFTILSTKNSTFVPIRDIFWQHNIKFCIRIRIYADLNIEYVNINSMQYEELNFLAYKLMVTFTHNIFKPSRMWCCVTGKVVSDILREDSTIFDCSPLKIKAVESCDRWKSTYPVTWHHIPNNSSLQQCYCENLKYHKLNIVVLIQVQDAQSWGQSHHSQKPKN